MEEIDEATQTLINDAVAKALEEANKKHKSEEDRRATDAYKKGQEAAKEEARKAQMSEEEKHSFELKELQKQNEELLNTIKLIKKLLCLNLLRLKYLQNLLNIL